MGCGMAKFVKCRTSKSNNEVGAAFPGCFRLEHRKSVSLSPSELRLDSTNVIVSFRYEDSGGLSESLAYDRVCLNPP